MLAMNEISVDMLEDDLRYLKLLSHKFPTISDACTEIINLQAILNLPKGTEHFLTDIHGEYEAFNHVLKNASGVIKRKVNDILGNTLKESERKELCTLIYYPEQKLELIINQEKEVDDWYRITLYRLIEICKIVSSKYTRSKVRKTLPPDFAYIIDELLNEQETRPNKLEYFNGILDTIIRIGRAKEFIIAICNVIQRLTVDRLHIVGDIYDRGPGAHIIMESLMRYSSIDIQWGNHDILWMGAAAGNECCISNVIRISTRYANLETLEDGYGVNLLPLATFAMDTYGNDPCKSFKPKITAGSYKETDLKLMAQMHKAISVIQFKLEGQVIKRRPSFNMEHRLLLDKMNLEKGTVLVDGKEYPLNDTNFPTIDMKDPYKLTKEESSLVLRLKSSFINSDKLQKHVRYLYSKGSLYLVCNSNLLYHACIPLDEHGNFRKAKLSGKEYSGKAYLDMADRLAREGYFNKGNSEKDLYSLDFLWYLWCGEDSPLFGKTKMATFERYFVDDKTTHTESKDAYFKFRDKEEICDMILTEFGLDPLDSHIINGHVPVKVVKGESPIKAGGKLLVIDGGFSKAYQRETGLAGYTLIYNSYGLQLVSHEPFESTQKAIEEGKDILSSSVILETTKTRKRVIDTDIGKELIEQISELEKLLTAYRKGLIKELK
ncbi:fructose-bisphosphatase class III [Clostridium sp. ATCC 25772]|uniref:fructose-bisphosphatase class III n=1 Tax=Clostridium sp. ATCC 25772 TaxID=1676991 RepID=UPI000781DEC3|nr:fructose-bisphosphatase class III [Clostridium sp. ATCC 25772]